MSVLYRSLWRRRPARIARIGAGVWEVTESLAVVRPRLALFRSHLLPAVGEDVYVGLSQKLVSLGPNVFPILLDCRAAVCNGALKLSPLNGSNYVIADTAASGPSAVFNLLPVFTRNL